MSYHKDRECNQALIHLMDALCEWERNAGRRSTLILIPHCRDENIVLAQDGKPLSGLIDDEHPLRFLVDAALGDRLPLDTKKCRESQPIGVRCRCLVPKGMEAKQA